MELTGLSFENYKAFAQREALELKPLTVLIGRNSSGKSAIARLPLLLARALSERAQSPVDLDIDGVDFGGSFVDLIHNRTPHGSIGLGATFENDQGERYEVWARVQHFSEFEMQVVSAFELKRTGYPALAFTWVLEDDPRVEPGRYKAQVGDGGDTFEVALSFQGLWPTYVQVGRGAVGETDPRLVQLFGELHYALVHLRPALARLGYLGPFRTPPQRQYRFPGGMPQSVGVSGAEAPALLGADLLRKGGMVVKAVGEWYRKSLGGWVLDVSRQGASFSLVLRSPDDQNVEVNLADVGTGLSQVLPLVVQRHVDALAGQSLGLEVVEQPELHLHPGAHGDLADLYIQAAQYIQFTRQPRSRFIIETHSENFILRIRRRIAEGVLDAGSVALYWVDDEPRPGSQLRRITLSPSGDVSTWPKGVFSEDFEEVRAIRAAQRGERHEEA
ncbi:AAA family ATPase [Archangium sp.]|uniref:AAA family ATPase n=1 Tax=Archangium sp. TaxID=1872627 RepID=UPI002D29DF27|nr:AAA family ATPase [Archangium sp.]HYO52048.1 AAA family ATPase [Archangium sp.]